MLTIEQINEEMLSRRFTGMTTVGSPASKQMIAVTQALMLQISMAQVMGEENMNMLTAIGAAFLLGMVAERDGWCLDEHVETP